MKKSTKSYPSPVSHVAKEVKAGGHVLLWVAVAVVVLVVAGPSLGSRAVNATLKAGVHTAANTATGVCAKDGLNHLCAVPANGARTYGPATEVTVPPKKVTAWTTPSTMVPYGPPNGPVKPLPSQIPPATIPPKGLPQPGESTGSGPLGELLGSIPKVGPALEGGLNAIKPALEAGTKAP